MNVFYFTSDLLESLMSYIRTVEVYDDWKKEIPEGYLNGLTIRSNHPFLKNKVLRIINTENDKLIKFNFSLLSLGTINKYFMHNIEFTEKVLIGYCLRYLLDPDMKLQAPNRFTKEKQEAHFKKVQQRNPDWITVGFTYDGRKRTYQVEMCTVKGHVQIRNGKEVQVRGHIRKFNNLKFSAN